MLMIQALYNALYLQLIHDNIRERFCSFYQRLGSDCTCEPCDPGLVRPRGEAAEGPHML